MDIAASRIFVDLSKEQQALELISYISSLKGETGENKPFSTKTRDLVTGNKLSDAVQATLAEFPFVLATAPDRELEGICNLQISLLRIVEPSKLSSSIDLFIKPFVTVEAPRPSLLLKILSNLFNNLDEANPSRYNVYLVIVQVAYRAHRISILVSHLPQIDSWLTLWNTDKSEARKLWSLLRDIFQKTGYISESHTCSVKFLSTYETAEDASVKDQLTKTIVQAINTPSLFDFDDIANLPLVKTLQKEQIVEVLQLYLSGDLKSFQAYQTAHKDFLASTGIDSAASLSKIRLLTLSSIAASHVGEEVPYATLATAIDVSPNELEVWLIEAIRYKFIEAKLDQLKQIVVISGATHRTFDQAQWQELAKKLSVWRSSINSVLQVVSNAKLIAQSQSIA